MTRAASRPVVAVRSRGKGVRGRRRRRAERGERERERERERNIPSIYRGDADRYPAPPRSIPFLIPMSHPNPLSHMQICDIYIYIHACVNQTTAPRVTPLFPLPPPPGGYSYPGAGRGPGGGVPSRRDPPSGGTGGGLILPFERARRGASAPAPTAPGGPSIFDDDVRNEGNKDPRMIS